MRQRPGVIDEGAKVANVNPPAALMTSDMVVSGFLTRITQPLVQTLAAQNGPHRKASFTRAMAGCSGFFTFTQFGDTPAR